MDGYYAESECFVLAYAFSNWNKIEIDHLYLNQFIIKIRSPVGKDKKPILFNKLLNIEPFYVKN